jgi:hypothetical protein
MSLDKNDSLQQVLAKKTDCCFHYRYVRPRKELRTCLLTTCLSETRQIFDTLFCIFITSLFQSLAVSENLLDSSNISIEIEEAKTP